MADYLGASISLFPIEGVKATIEVKSDLKEKDLIQACKAGEHVANLWPNNKGNSQNLNVPRRFLVAYSSKATLDTIFGWLVNYYYAAEFSRGDMTRVGLREGICAGEKASLSQIRSSTLDGIFIFGKGVILFQNFGFSIHHGALAKAKSTHQLQNVLWHILTAETGAAHLLFLALMESVLDSELLLSYSKTLKFRRWDKKEMNYLNKA